MAVVSVSSARIVLVALAAGAASPLAQAGCIDEVARVRAVANAMTNELSRRVALYHLEVAVNEHFDTDEDECRDHLAEAELIVQTQPFTLAPGERLGLPETQNPPAPRSGVRPR